MRNSRLYRRVYEENFGTIPKGYHIHHKDGNHENNHPSNLIAVTPEQHARLHFEMGLMWKGGDRSKWIVGASDAGKLGGKITKNKIDSMTPADRSQWGRNWGKNSSRNLGKKTSNEKKELLRLRIIEKPMWSCACGKTIRFLQGNIKQHKAKCEALQ